MDILKDLFDSSPEESEDCLYVNAFAPTSPQPPQGRPVLLFIHGGGWQQGNAWGLDLSGFAAYEDIVAFTFNYRTNSTFLLTLGSLRSWVELLSNIMQYSAFPTPRAFRLGKQTSVFTTNNSPLNGFRSMLELLGAIPPK